VRDIKIVLLKINMCSQASQDIFVISALKNKRNGTFLEIGSNDPVFHNNTYILETQYGWRGTMIEYDSVFESKYKELRPNSTYQIKDARTVDYREALKNYPANMDYLQIDLDVDNKSTIDTLELLDKTVFDNTRFAVVTFEHDIYTGNHYNTQERSREIFTKRGYELVFPNVSVYFNGGERIFEDWYVHPDLVDMKLIDSVRSQTSLNHNEIINRFNKN
jgi:hypothetical protein